MLPAAVRNCGDADAETVGCVRRRRLAGGRRVRFETQGEVEEQIEGRSESEIGGGWREEEGEVDCRGGRGGEWGEEKGGCSRRGLGGGGGCDGDGDGENENGGVGLEAPAVDGSGGCLVSGSHGRAEQDGVASRASRAQSWC